MKIGKEILLLSLVTVPLLVLVGCGKKADEDVSSDELIIEPLVGFESVRFGMSKDEITKYFGQPDKVHTQTNGTKLNYVASKGLGFEVDSELGLRKIQCWSKS